MPKDSQIILDKDVMELLLKVKKVDETLESALNRVLKKYLIISEN